MSNTQDYYLIHKESGEIIEEGKKGRLRRIQKKMEDKEDYKVSKNSTLTATKKKRVKEVDLDEEENEEEEEHNDGDKIEGVRKTKRIRFKGPRALSKRPGKMVKRKIKIKPETEEDMKKMIKGGINTRCKRRKDKGGREHEIEIFHDKLFSK